jgi:hypothetical protein
MCKRSVSGWLARVQDASLRFSVCRGEPLLKTEVPPRRRGVRCLGGGSAISAEFSTLRLGRSPQSVGQLISGLEARGEQRVSAPQVLLEVVAGPLDPSDEAAIDVPSAACAIVCGTRSSRSWLRRRATNSAIQRDLRTLLLRAPRARASAPAPRRLALRAQLREAHALPQCDIDNPKREEDHRRPSRTPSYDRANNHRVATTG